jgi:DNA-binding PadR family transcriptional regulator
MMTHADFPGEFEQIVLLAVVALGDGAYAVPVRREILRHTGRDVSRGAVYITLDRLQAKGYLASRQGDPTPARGGRARRYYRVTPAGLAAVRRARTALDRLWAAAGRALGEAAP